MLHRMMAAGFENIQEAGEVGFDVIARMGEGVTYACLRGEMDDAVRLVFGEQPVHRFMLVDVSFRKGKAVARLELCEPCPFQGDIVIAVEIVEADDLVTAIEQGARGMEADKAGGASEENSHDKFTVKRMDKVPEPKKLSAYAFADGACRRVKYVHG